MLGILLRRRAFHMIRGRSSNVVAVQAAVTLVSACLFTFTARPLAQVPRLYCSAPPSPCLLGVCSSNPVNTNGFLYI